MDCKLNCFVPEAGKNSLKLFLKSDNFKEILELKTLLLESSKYLKGLLNITTCPSDRGIDFSNAWKILSGGH